MIYWNGVPAKLFDYQMRSFSKAARSGFAETTAGTHSKIVDLCRLGRFDEALRILTSISFNTYLCSSFLQFCIDSKTASHGRYLHDYLERNGFFPSDVYLNTKFIVFYSKIGDVNSARRVFEEMPRRSVVSWTALISGYTQNGYPRKALETFRTMHHLGLKCNDFAYGSILRACTVLMYVKNGEEVHECALKVGFCGSLFIQSALIDLYSKCGRPEKARFIFESMLERDVVSWNVVIGGYAARGLDDEAFRMFRDMLSNGKRGPFIVFFRTWLIFSFNIEIMA